MVAARFDPGCSRCGRRHDHGLLQAGQRESTVPARPRSWSPRVPQRRTAGGAGEAPWPVIQPVDDEAAFTATDQRMGGEFEFSDNAEIAAPPRRPRHQLPGRARRRRFSNAGCGGLNATRLLAAQSERRKPLHPAAQRQPADTGGGTTRRGHPGERGPRAWSNRRASVAPPPAPARLSLDPQG